MARAGWLIAPAEASPLTDIPPRERGDVALQAVTLARGASLRDETLDPSARLRLIELIANLKGRVQDAELNGLLGEVASLHKAARKLIGLDRTKIRASGPGDLGIPVITTE
jgi:hypothetical protein